MALPKDHSLHQAARKKSVLAYGLKVCCCSVVKPRIDLAPGAELNSLACWAHEQLLAALAGASSAKLHELRSLRAAVVFVAVDQRFSTTLRFDHGDVTIHDGIVGIPDLTFCGDLRLIESLIRLRFGRFSRLPLLRDQAVRRFLADVASGELKVYGLFTKLHTVVRVLRLFQN